MPITNFRISCDEAGVCLDKNIVADKNPNPLIT